MIQVCSKKSSSTILLLQKQCAVCLNDDIDDLLNTLQQTTSSNYLDWNRILVRYRQIYFENIEKLVRQLESENVN